MTDGRAPAASGLAGAGSGDGKRGLRSVEERSRELADDRAALEEVLGHVTAEAQALRMDVAALSAERSERERELAQARERLAALDASILAARNAETAKAHERAVLEKRLEHARESSKELELDTLAHREELSAAHERLGELVDSVMRIQHKLRRVAPGDPGRGGRR